MIKDHVPHQNGFIRVPLGVECGVGVESHGVLRSPVAEFGSVAANVDYLPELGLAVD
jgi:hypothetical protein